MDKMRIYLDNCCFNRPYDNQDDIKIRIETEAKLNIQEKVKNNLLELAWSYILDFENYNNPFLEKRIEIQKWSSIAKYNIIENDNILNSMNNIIKIGLKPLDSLHISCAIELNCDFFITVDRGILKKKHLINNIEIINPIDFIYGLEEK